MNPDGTRWCDRCSPKFRWFNAVAEYKPAGSKYPPQPAQELRNRADRIRSSIVRPTRMVCKPCAEKNDDQDHRLVKSEIWEREFEERAANPEKREAARREFELYQQAVKRRCEEREEQAAKRRRVD